MGEASCPLFCSAPQAVLHAAVASSSAAEQLAADRLLEAYCSSKSAGQGVLAGSVPNAAAAPAASFGSYLLRSLGRQGSVGTRARRSTCRRRGPWPEVPAQARTSTQLVLSSAHTCATLLPSWHGPATWSLPSILHPCIRPYRAFIIAVQTTPSPHPQPRIFMHHLAVALALRFIPPHHQPPLAWPNFSTVFC